MFSCFVYLYVYVLCMYMCCVYVYVHEETERVAARGSAQRLGLTVVEV